MCSLKCTLQKGGQKGCSFIWKRRPPFKEREKAQKIPHSRVPGENVWLPDPPLGHVQLSDLVVLVHVPLEAAVAPRLEIRTQEINNIFIFPFEISLTATITAVVLSSAWSSSTATWMTTIFKTTVTGPPVAVVGGTLVSMPTPPCLRE